MLLHLLSHSKDRFDSQRIPGLLFECRHNSTFNHQITQYVHCHQQRVDKYPVSHAHRTRFDPALLFGRLWLGHRLRQTALQRSA